MIDSMGNTGAKKWFSILLGLIWDETDPSKMISTNHGSYVPHCPTLLASQTPP